MVQRLTAALMVPLIIGHLAVIFYASHKGLAAADILSRTKGSIGWALFYGVFVVAASVHGAIGVRTVASEWTPRSVSCNTRALDFFMWAFGLGLAFLGLRAVAAVVL